MNKLAHILTVGAVGLAVFGCTSTSPPLCSHGESQTVALGDALPGGGTAADVLTRAAGIRRGMLRWFQRQEFQIVPPPEPTTFEIEITSAATSARYRAGQQGESAQSNACPGQVEVDAMVRFVTADGGLDERWTLPVTADDDGYLSSFQIDLREHPPAGTLRVTYTGTEPVGQSWTWFRGDLDSVIASGLISFSASGAGAGEQTGFGTTLAEWTSDPPR